MVTHIAVILVFLVVSDGRAFGRQTALMRMPQTARDTNLERWVQSNYEKALTKLLPTGMIALEKFPKNVQWAVTVRILPPFEKPEYRLYMQKTYDGRIEASITAPRVGSIKSQLRILKQKHPRASFEKLVSLIAMEHRTTTAAQQPQLVELAKEFETIKMSPVLPDVLGVDETGYELWSQSLWGNRIEIKLSGPGSEARQQPHPILEWTELFRRMIKVR